MHVSIQSAILALALAGCAETAPTQYEWNAAHTAANTVELPGSPYSPRCQLAFLHNGFADNSWRWHQVTNSTFIETCTDNYGRVASTVLPNNSLLSNAPGLDLAAIAIPAATSLGSAALVRDPAAGLASGAINIGIQNAGSMASSSVGNVGAYAAGGNAVSNSAASSMAHNTTTNNLSASSSSRATSRNLNINNNNLRQTQGQHQS